MVSERVLVTGATGFLAGHGIAELLAHGYAVRGSVRRLATADVAHLRAVQERTGSSLELAEASLDADEGWAEALKDCDYVWHMASPNGDTIATGASVPVVLNFTMVDSNKDGAIDADEFSKACSSGLVQADEATVKDMK